MIGIPPPAQFCSVEDFDLAPDMVTVYDAEEIRPYDFIGKGAARGGPRAPVAVTCHCCLTPCCPPF